MAIQVRRGLKKDFIPEKLLPGEWAVSIDSETENQIVWMCFAPGVVKRMGTYEDFTRQTQEVLDGVSTSVDTVTIIKSDIADNLFPQIQQYAQDTEDRSIMAESYTHGGTGKREDEDTDNARYYMNRARLITGGDYATHEEIEGVENKINGIAHANNPNLIDNAWFTVNTRGEIKYSTYGKYCLDRWKMNGYAVEVKDYGVDLSCGSMKFVGLEQKLDSSRIPDDKPLTLSILLADGTIYSATGNSNSDIECNNGHGSGITYTASSKTVNVSVAVRTTIQIRAVKLEVGEVCTLGVDSAPNKALEVYKCYNSTADFFDSYTNGYTPYKRNWQKLVTKANLGSGSFDIPNTASEVMLVYVDSENSQILTSMTCPYSLLNATNMKMKITHDNCYAEIMSKDTSLSEFKLTVMGDVLYTAIVYYR